MLQTEREYVSRTFSMVHAALKKINFVIGGLSVRTANMEKNQYVQNGLLLSEAVMMHLSDALGRQEAHEIVYQICMDVFEKGGSLKDALLAEPEVASKLSPEAIDRMLDPHAYTGLAAQFVDRVLERSCA